MVLGINLPAGVGAVGGDEAVGARHAAQGLLAPAVAAAHAPPAAVDALILRTDRTFSLYCADRYTIVVFVAKNGKHI